MASFGMFSPPHESQDELAMGRLAIIGGIEGFPVQNGTVVRGVQDTMHRQALASYKTVLGKESRGWRKRRLGHLFRLLRLLCMHFERE